MSAVSNKQIYDTLLSMRGDIGGLLTTVQLQQSQFTAHVAEDRAIAKDVSDIKLKLAGQRGSAKVWTMISHGVVSALSAVIGVVGAHYSGK